jgi:hypothetical protein
MKRVTDIAKIIAAVGAIVGAYSALPEPYSVIVQAIIAAAAVLARSPLEAKPGA